MQFFKSEKEGEEETAEQLRLQPSPLQSALQMFKNCSVSSAKSSGCFIYSIVGESLAFLWDKDESKLHMKEKRPSHFFPPDDTRCQAAGVPPLPSLASTGSQEVPMGSRCCNSEAARMFCGKQTLQRIAARNVSSAARPRAAPSSPACQRSSKPRKV